MKLRRALVAMQLVVLSLLGWLLFNAYVWHSPTGCWAIAGVIQVWASQRAAEWLVRS